MKGTVRQPLVRYTSNLSGSRGEPIINSYGGISLHKQSHGESFLALVENCFGGNGLYILDEPEAALSPVLLLRLMVYMTDLVKRNSQFIISTHSPMLMAFPDAQVVEITEGSIYPVSFRSTEHYQVTRRFLEKLEQMLEGNRINTALGNLNDLRIGKGHKHG